MPGKMYFGSWSLGSHVMMISSKAYLIIAMRYRTQNGIPIQHCTDSRLGIPISVNTEGMETVMLVMGVVSLGLLMQTKNISLSVLLLLLLPIIIQSHRTECV